jgi:hypothetical protein
LVEELISILDTPDAQETPAATEDSAPTDSRAAASTAPPGSTPASESEGNAPSTPSDASASSEAPAETTPKPETTSLEGGEPFVFKADRREIRPEGARVVGDKIVFDKAKWPAFASQHVADRTVWRQEKATWDRERAEFQAQLQAKTPEQEKATAFAQEIDRIASLKDPREIQALVQHWQTHWSTYLLKKENELLKERTTQWTQAQQQQAEQESLDALIPEMHDHLAGAFDHYLAQDGLKVLGAHKDALFAEYLETEGDIRNGGRAYRWDPEQQAYFLDVPRLERWLTREAKREQDKAELVKRHAEAAKRNAGATAKTVGAPHQPAPPAKPATGRDDKGRFARPEDDEDRHERELTSVDFWFGKG